MASNTPTTATASQTSRPVPKTLTSFRQIRAHHDEQTITVYQAYSAEIAVAAVQHQKLNASRAFSVDRMTWIKPSWAWMLYRAGYSYKDPRQNHILALTMTREAFINLLRRAVLSHGSGPGTSNARKSMENSSSEEGVRIPKPTEVRVQWDPERTVRLEKLAYRSIQIGIPRGLVPEWVEGIVKIEDVTTRARDLKRMLDEEDAIGLEDLASRGLVPLERVFEVDDELRQILEMGSDE